MPRKTKREKMIEAAAIAHSSRSKSDLENAMHHMLWVLAEGTRYQEDVEIAYEMLEKYRKIQRAGGRTY
ncbi:hypothetical protein [Lysinibacillus sp. 54212]|uniref:hypothetical protein n=1 Tax=Lysinibacillus sp. 54212 TaxID=3119829 RepID=UPI002FCB078A